MIDIVGRPYFEMGTRWSGLLLFMQKKFCFLRWVFRAEHLTDDVAVGHLRKVDGGTASGGLNW